MIQDDDRKCLDQGCTAHIGPQILPIPHNRIFAVPLSDENSKDALTAE